LAESKWLARLTQGNSRDQINDLVVFSDGWLQREPDRWVLDHQFCKKFGQILSRMFANPQKEGDDGDRQNPLHGKVVDAGKNVRLRQFKVGAFNPHCRGEFTGSHSDGFDGFAPQGIPRSVREKNCALHF
jgi:hypothetical protein